MIAAAMDQNRVKEPEKAPSEAGSWDSDESIVTFKPQQIQELQKALNEIYNEHAPGKQVYNATNSIIEVSKVITLFAGTVLAKYPEMEDSCREIFRDILYSIRDKGLKTQLDCDLTFKDTP